MKAVTMGFMITSLLTQASFAFEVDTHAFITQRAFERSSFASDGVIAERLGLDRYQNGRPFDVPRDIQTPVFRVSQYLDLEASRWQQSGQAGYRHRDPQEYEMRQMSGAFREDADRALEYSAWLMRGAVREDDLPQAEYDESPIPDADPYGETFRVFHHFYDPVNDRPLTLAVACDLLPGTPAGGVCMPSIDWAFGSRNADQNITSPPSTNRRNHFSWADAREAMWCGLTYTRSGESPQNDAATRRLCWATSMKSLGHVLHLLQDTGQPQHTRNDRHNPTEDGSPAHNAFLATDTARRMFEVYVNWRATDGVEISTAKFERPLFHSLFGHRAAAKPLVAGSYPIPRFSTPVDYFTTRRSGAPAVLRHGLADFSNRNFYTDGTVFSSEYPSPPASPSDPSLTLVEGPARETPGVGTYRESEWRGAIIETVAPTHTDAALQATGGRIPLVREGIFRRLLSAAPTRWHVLPVEILDVHADVLVPRAVAYSTGLIDFFFRGTLAVSAPPDGAIGIIDHADPHKVDASGYPRVAGGGIYGFSRIRMSVRNTTPSITVSGSNQTVAQRASGGNLVAVARYHRNPCYLPNLDGELTIVFPPGEVVVPRGGACAGTDALRTNYEEIAVSRPITINAQLDGPSPWTASFDFSSSPIPINATDLRIQAVYRGALGDERDGIAVGMVDILEPSYYLIANNSDYLLDNGAWLPTSPSDPRLIFRPFDVDVVEADLFAPPAAPSGVRLFSLVQDLPPARFLRVAVLFGPAPFKLSTLINFEGIGPLRSVREVVATAGRQGAREELAAGEYAPSVMERSRGITFGLAAYVFYRRGQGQADLSQLPPFAIRDAMRGVVAIGPGLLADAAPWTVQWQSSTDAEDAGSGEWTMFAVHR